MTDGERAKQFFIGPTAMGASIVMWLRPDALAQGAMLQML
jgi:hypothetical protein